MEKISFSDLKTNITFFPITYERKLIKEEIEEENMIFYFDDFQKVKKQP